MLGNGHSIDSATPVAVSGLSGVIAIAAGDNHTCALVIGGGVFCWGANESGQLGGEFRLGSSILPEAVAGLTGATAISAGTAHTCAVVSGGNVVCWGLLGNELQPSPVAISGLAGVTAVSAGGGRTCAVASGGQIWCWDDETPVMVGGLRGAATALAVSATHTCAVRDNGAVMCWGGFSEFGLGGHDGTDIPFEVPGLGPLPTSRPSYPATTATSDLSAATAGSSPPSSSGASSSGASSSGGGSDVLLAGVLCFVALLLLLLVAWLQFESRPSRTRLAREGRRRWPAMTSTPSKVLFLCLCLVIGVGSGIAWTLTATPVVQGSFTPTGHMIHGVTFDTSMSLADGRVMVIGNYPDSRYSWVGIDSVQIYDPKTGEFSETAPEFGQIGRAHV
jgi:hypothetical protein